MDSPTADQNHLPRMLLQYNKCYQGNWGEHQPIMGCYHIQTSLDMTSDRTVSSAVTVAAGCSLKHRIDMTSVDNLSFKREDSRLN